MVDVLRTDETSRTIGDRDAAHLGPVTPSADVLINRIHWGAVLAGVVVALVAQLILNLIGIGIGASALEPGAGTEQNPSAQGFSIGAAAWWTVSGILAALAGGFTAGRLSGQPKQSTAAWHGLTSWALTTILVFWLLTSTIGGVLGGAYRGLMNVADGLASTTGGAIQTAAQTAAPSLAAGNGNPVGAIEQTLRDAIGGSDGAALRDAAVAAVRAIVTGNQQQADDARMRAADAVAKARNIPVEEARAQIQQFEQQYRQGLEAAGRQATEAAATATRTVARGALISAVALLLGAVAAWFGGGLGASNRQPSPVPPVNLPPDSR